MANKALAFSLLILSLASFLGSMAQIELQPEQLFQSLGNQQQHRLRAKTSCHIQQLQAREPTRRLDYEAGSVEFWDANSEEFECAGIEFIRHTIQPKGLLLPYYANAPKLIYIIQGSGIQGTVIPGCAETYESGSSSYSATESESERGEGEQGRGRRANDRHQKLRRFRQGDILALQPGITYWAYNDGDTPIISISVLDVANEANQLDLKYRKFLVAGNTQTTGTQGRREEQDPSRGQQTRRHEEIGEQEGEEQQKRNIFAGFDQEFLAEALNVDPDVIRRLQATEDNRGAIVRAERPDLVLPEWGRQEQEREQEQPREGSGYANGVEETFCSLKIRHNIDHPSKTDIYNPRAGWVTRLNGHKLPILNHLRLSADRGVLYRNAMKAPHWNINSHTLMYVIRGSARIQVVGNQGNTVYDEEIQEGQLLVVPQNFATVKRAGENGFEWVAFSTNNDAMIEQLAGRLSVFRAMPEEVLMNAYSISREDARRLKYNREEATLLSPRGSRPEGQPRDNC